jgi:homoserine dehydrogenase
MAAPYRIGLVGFGNIGTGLVKHLRDFGDTVAQRLEGGIELGGIADVDFDTPREVQPPASAKLTNDWKELVADDSLRAIVELVGVGRDGKPTLAFAIAKATLESGKTFVTANKGLICAHGAELHAIAEKNNAQLFYEASVGAGIPIISSMQTMLAGDRLNGIHGMVNGTCNYIMMRMEQDPSTPVDAVIKDAQDLGYAEPDPTFDVGGHDSAYKIVILAALAFNQKLTFSDVRLEGLTELGAPELAYAKENGLVPKLLASAQLLDDGSADLCVGPAFLPKTHILSGVNGVFNAVLIQGEPIGDTLYYGAGAGQGSTASGLIGDLMLAAKTERAGAKSFYSLTMPSQGGKVASKDAVVGRHYVRLDVESAAVADAVVNVGIPGQVIGKTDKSVIFITEKISFLEYENLLGKIKAAGVNWSSLAHVRFAFE